VKFSIVIPTHNPLERELMDCLLSATHDDAEILLADDCSTNWFEQRGKHETCMGVEVIRSEKQGGPGAARNMALGMARGEWIVFLDSDDMLADGALDKLSAFIAAHPDVDAIGYGWDWAHNRGHNQRKDGQSLALPKREMLAEYLKLRMDGSVIFTAVKRSLIEDNGLRFRHGLHEDIDFIFDVYRLANKTAYLPEILYHKTQRAGAITSSITQAHVDGFFDGWFMIGQNTADMLSGAPLSMQLGESASELMEAYEIGTVGVIATRIREVAYKAANSGMMEKLRASIPEAWKLIVKHSPLDTTYARAAKQFLSDDIFDPSIFEKSWSCTDLQGSLFLAPDEIRTCCKRFFVNGEMRGDVRDVVRVQLGGDGAHQRVLARAVLVRVKLLLEVAGALGGKMRDAVAHAHPVGAVASRTYGFGLGFSCGDVRSPGARRVCAMRFAPRRAIGPFSERFRANAVTSSMKRA